MRLVRFPTYKLTSKHNIMEKKTKAAPAKTATAKATTSKAATSNAATSKSATATKLPAKKGAAKGLQDLFEDSLKDIYWAEKALSKALPKMEKNASSPELKKAIAGHLQETTNQIARLEKCFESIGKKAAAKKCDAMEGLLKEGKGIMEDTQMGSVRDAGIIAAAQKIEHYEIATYGTLAAFAKVLGHKEALKEILSTLSEEKACDEKLTAIADTALNTAAING